jgi:diguanylate cyclase (GGDEF)-like protein
MTTIDTDITRALRTFATLIGATTLCVSLVVLVGGWAHDIPAFKSVLPGSNTMKPNTAICLGALGASLILAQHGPRARTLSSAAAFFALAIGAVTLAEYAFDWSPGIDQAFFKDPATSGFPGRPALATAVSIVLLAVALLSVGYRMLVHLKAAAALATCLIAWLTLNSYLISPATLTDVTAFSSVAVHTAILLLLLGVGALATHPVSWPLETALARGASGIVCRWLLPPALLAPALLGWLFKHLGSTDALASNFTWALYSVCSSAGSVGLIVLLARRIAVIEAERAAATELSRRDPLTGLPNRRSFDTFLAENFALSKRHGHALSLLLIDVDRFKAYNDTYGHPAGDELLKAISAGLLSVVRTTDLAARMGGDELAVVLPETDLAGAQILAERIRLAVNRSPQHRREISVSIGVATLSQSILSTSMLLKECDAALYRAKRSGRNQISGRTLSTSFADKAR